MTKKVTSLNIEEEVIADMKKNLYNMSEEAEKAFRAKLGKENIEVNIMGDENCFICGREQRKATSDDMKGLTWLWPDEQWICNGCLKRHSRGIAQ